MSHMPRYGTGGGSACNSSGCCTQPRVVTYTANGAEGVDFFVSIGATLANDEYEVGFFGTAGAANVPVIDFPNEEDSDRTEERFRVLLAAELTEGDVLKFMVIASCASIAEPEPEPVTPTPIMIASYSQSNYLDNVDWSAADPGLGLSDVFPDFFITRKTSGADTDPITWVERPREQLQPSDVPNSANMGPWLSGGRLAARNGVYEGVQLGIQGLEAAKMVPTATYPTVGPNVFSQFMTLIAVTAELSGTELGIVIYSQGETDAQDATKASLWQSRVQAIFDEIWETYPDCVMVIPLLNSNGDASMTHLTTIRAAAVALTVANPGKVGTVETSDLPMKPDGLHYFATEITTIGNRCTAEGLRLREIEPPAIEGDYVEFRGSNGGVYDDGAIVVSSLPDAQPGDREFLLINTNYLAAAISVPDLQGFAAIEADDSTWTIVNVQAGLYTRVVTQAAMDANGGFMPSVTIADTNDQNVATIYSFRGPNGVVGLGNHDAAANDTSTTAIAFPTISTGVANALVVNFWTGWTGNYNNTASGFSNGDLEELEELQDSVFNILTQGIVMGCVGGKKAEAGAVGATTGVFVSAAVQVTFTVELRP